MEKVPEWFENFVKKVKESPSIVVNGEERSIKAKASLKNKKISHDELIKSLKEELKVLESKVKKSKKGK
jgi:hypothetical protein